MTAYLGSDRWKPATLQDLVTFQRGFDITKAEQKEGEIPVISSSGVSSWHNEAMVEGPGVVIGRKGSLGTVHYSEGAYWPHDTTLWSKSLNGNNPRFAYYALKLLRLERFNVGGANPTLNRNHIHRLPIFLADRKIQDEIARILSAYDDLIENNRRRIGLMAEAARLLYREWFVYFRFPGHEHLKIINGLPEGWERRSLGELAVDVDYGFTESASHDVEGPKFLRITDIVNGPINWSSVPRCPISEEKLQRFLLDPGDVVVARTGATTGWAKRVGRMSELSVFASYLVRFRFDEAYRPELAATFMESDAYKAFVRANLGGAAQPNASAVVLGNALVPVPTSGLQKDFADAVAPMHEQIDTLMEQNQKLAQARDLLLPRLMNGEIAV